MQEDFHYYATYCAAFLAGYSHEESLEIGYSAQFVDCCTETLLSKIKGPASAATTQLQMEMMNTPTDVVGLQKITRIWSAFHFLPYDLYATLPKRTKKYLHKYRLICKPNGRLLVDTVNLAKGASLQAAGVAMHILADTWAHSYFAGTPSLVINNTNRYFYEILRENGEETERKIHFRHNLTAPDDPEAGLYTSSIYQGEEKTIMNLGHGRAGHLPDYSFIRYRYMPAWGDYEIILKDNPSDYYHAFCQMIYALKFLRGEYDSFETERYAEDVVAPWKDEIMGIIEKRQIDACADWKTFGEKLSGFPVEEFHVAKYEEAYIRTPKEEKHTTFLVNSFWQL